MDAPEPAPGLAPGLAPEPDAVLAAVDRVQVDALQRAYADAVTRRSWADVASLFLPDAVLSLDLVTRPGMELSGPEAIVGFIAPAVEGFEFFEFAIVNSHVELWPGDDRTLALGRIFMCELRVPRGGSERSDAFGRYEDTYRKVDGAWRIAGRRYRSMARFPEGTVFPLDG